MVWYSKVTKGEHPWRKYSRRHTSRIDTLAYTDQAHTAEKVIRVYKATFDYGDEPTVT